MFAAIENLPVGAIGFEAIGRITETDRTTVLEPTIETVLQDGHPVRLLYLAGPRFHRLRPERDSSTTRCSGRAISAISRRSRSSSRTVPIAAP